MNFLVIREVPLTETFSESVVKRFYNSISMIFYTL